jgi:hypothetical protein
MRGVSQDSLLFYFSHYPNTRFYKTGKYFGKFKDSEIINAAV